MVGTDGPVGWRARGRTVWAMSDSMTAAASATPDPSVRRAPPSARMSRSVVVFACGDGDDGDASVAGLAVASLPPRTRSAADVRRVPALQAEHLLDLPDEQPVVVVDAIGGIEAGEIIEVDLGDVRRGAAAPGTCSCHRVALDSVIGLAAYLREAPFTGRFVGVGIGSPCPGEVPGEVLSAPVRAALPAFREAVAAAVEAIRTDVH
jgi:Ni,Fe-hydrogenase maturation factor